MNINGYTILDKIADGGMATVYMAEKTATQQRVALKVLSPELAADDLSVVQRFVDEADIVAKLEDKAVIPVLGTGLSDGYAYMAMEYMPGGNLREKIDSGLTETDILQIVTRIAEALGYAHQKGILHLDVCPRNILFRNNGDPVLADFGISKKYLEPDFDDPSPVMGNPRYMSPEQIRGDKTGPATDLYSLGVIFYEMLAGHLPYEAEDSVKTARMHLYEVPEPLPAHYSHYQTVIDQLLEKMPERRFHSANELLNALGELHSSVAVLDDKTLIYPLKQSASGQMSSGSGQTATVIQDEAFFGYDDVAITDNFADQTAPLPVEEVLHTELESDAVEHRLEDPAEQFEPPAKSPAESDDGLELLEMGPDSALTESRHEKTADQFALVDESPVEHDDSVELLAIEPDSVVAESRQEETADQFEPLNKPPTDDDDAVGLVSLKTEQPAARSHAAMLEIEADERAITDEFAVDPDVLIAVRDDLSTTPLAKKRFSLLNVLVILGLFLAALWLWSQYRETLLETITSDSSETKHRSAAMPEDEMKRDSKPVESADANRQAEFHASEQDTAKSSIPSQDSAEAVDKTLANAGKPDADEVVSEVIPGSIASNQSSSPGEGGKITDIPLTEILLEPDTGIMLSDDQFIISYRLENTLKKHSDKLQREFDGSLRLFLERSDLYQNSSRAISRDGMNLLSRLAYVFRNNQDFMVLVTDRNIGIDAPDSYRISAASASNVRDFLISQGLQGKRVRSVANSREYRGNFSGIEIQLIPEIPTATSVVQTNP